MTGFTSPRPDEYAALAGLGLTVQEIARTACVNTKAVRRWAARTGTELPEDAPRPGSYAEWRQNGRPVRRTDGGRIIQTGAK